MVDACSEVYVPLDGKINMYTTGSNETSWSDRLKQDNSPIRKVEDERILDEFSLFGDCVASKLRRINNPQARSIAQYYINTILFRAEMTNFKNDTIVVPSPQEFGLFDSLRKDPVIENSSKTEDAKSKADEST